MPITNIRVYSQGRDQLILTAPAGIMNNAGPVDIDIPVAAAALFAGGPNPYIGPFNIEYFHEGYFQCVSLPNYVLVGGAVHHFN